MQERILKNTECGVTGKVDETPALEALVSRIYQAMRGISEAEERFRYSIDRLGADAAPGKLCDPHPQAPVADTFLSRLREVAEFAENMRDDLHEQARRLNRLV